MLRLNLAREPYWLDLGLGVRVRVEPLTTALMAARSDPEVRGLSEDTGDDEIAVIFGKVLAERAILDWEGVGDANGNPTPVTPEGIAALLDIWPIFEKFQMGYVAKGLELEQEKTPPRPRRVGLRRGRRLLRGLRRGLPGLPANPERPAHL